MMNISISIIGKRVMIKVSFLNFNLHKKANMDLIKKKFFVESLL